jgi:protein-S-isoprenylcysteine O-methyltransferase Ste14
VTALRLLLCSGLLVHKLLWETLKRRDAGPVAREAAPVSAPVRAVKALKAVALGSLIVQTLFLDVLPIAKHPAPLRRLGTAMYLVGLITAIAGRVQLGKNWADIEDAEVQPGQDVLTTGVYRFIRHPIYGGDVLLLIGLELALNSWLVLASLVPLVVVIRRATAEEAMLTRTFPRYADYRARTKGFIPFVL